VIVVAAIALALLICAPGISRALERYAAKYTYLRWFPDKDRVLRPAFGRVFALILFLGSLARWWILR
jgi:hypothetical protein